ncbi:ribosomal protein S5 domain 2-type protein [Cyathus striatus]|nr:ribosomal protein S5 domain 2-type protein [Cyathus striatus]
MTSATAISKAERSYIQTGLLFKSPQRADGRSLLDFRSVALETGVAPLANGSARISIGRSQHDGAGGTEDVEESESEGTDGGRLVCTVSCSPAAYSHLSSGALEDFQYDLTTVLHQTLSHPSLLPNNLRILPKKKAWVLHLDLLVLADAGNIYDALFMAARSALWDTKVPRTRSVEYTAKKGGLGGSGKVGGAGDMDVDEEATSGFDTRHIQHARDFELPDYWDEGEILDGRSRWPVCITLYLLLPTHFLDAGIQEEAAVPLRILLMFSFATPGDPDMQAMRLIGPGELTVDQLQDLMKDGEKYARDLFVALDMKLKDEDIRRNQKARERFAKR